MPWAISDFPFATHKEQKTTKPTNMSNQIKKRWLTLNIRQSSSRQLNLPACFHGMRKIVFSAFIHLSPGKLSLRNRKCVNIFYSSQQWSIFSRFCCSNFFSIFFRFNVTFQSSSPATVSAFADFSRRPYLLFLFTFFSSNLFMTEIYWREVSERERAEGGEDSTDHGSG